MSGHGAVVERSDLGPDAILLHGDFRLLELPVMGRRRQREPVHERLWRTGRISGAEFEAGEAYARAWSVASGAREGRADAGRVDGCGSAAGWLDAAVDAAAWLRNAQQRMGMVASRLVEVACCECWPSVEIARRFFGGDGGAARDRADAAVAAALAALAGGAIRRC